MPNDYRIVEKCGLHEPQMLYNCGDVSGLKWFPLDLLGYWADPDAFSFGLITKDSLMTRSQAEQAIHAAKTINGDFNA